jgi:hypothetical protein
MVYNTQNYWAFALLPSSGILENRKHSCTHVRAFITILIYIFLLSPAELAWSQVMK